MDHNHRLQLLLVRFMGVWDRARSHTAPAARTSTDATMAMALLCDEECRKRAQKHGARWWRSRRELPPGAHTLADNVAARLAAMRETQRFWLNPSAPPDAQAAPPSVADEPGPPMGSAPAQSNLGWGIDVPTTVILHADRQVRVIVADLNNSTRVLLVSPFAAWSLQRHLCLQKPLETACAQSGSDAESTEQRKSKYADYPPPARLGAHSKALQRCMTRAECYLGDGCSCCVAGDGARGERIRMNQRQRKKQYRLKLEQAHAASLHTPNAPPDGADKPGPAMPAQHAQTGNVAEPTDPLEEGRADNDGDDSENDDSAEHELCTRAKPPGSTAVSSEMAAGPKTQPVATKLDQWSNAAGSGATDAPSAPTPTERGNAGARNLLGTS